LDVVVSAEVALSYDDAACVTIDMDKVALLVVSRICQRDRSGAMDIADRPAKLKRKEQEGVGPILL
jgi:hypothetical protein